MRNKIIILSLCSSVMLHAVDFQKMDDFQQHSSSIIQAASNYNAEQVDDLKDFEIIHINQAQESEQKPKLGFWASQKQKWTNCWTTKKQEITRSLKNSLLTGIENKAVDALTKALKNNLRSTNMYIEDDGSGNRRNVYVDKYFMQSLLERIMPSSAAFVGSWAYRAADYKMDIGNKITNAIKEHLRSFNDKIIDVSESDLARSIAKSLYNYMSNTYLNYLTLEKTEEIQFQKALKTSQQDLEAHFSQFSPKDFSGFIAYEALISLNKIIEQSVRETLPSLLSEAITSKVECFAQKHIGTIPAAIVKSLMPTSVIRAIFQVTLPINKLPSMVSEAQIQKYHRGYVEMVQCADDIVKIDEIAYATGQIATHVAKNATQSAKAHIVQTSQSMIKGVKSVWNWTKNCYNEVKKPFEFDIDFKDL